MEKFKLKAAIIAKGFKISDVAKALEIDRSTLSRKMKDPDNFTSKEIKTITDFLGLSNKEMNDIFFSDYCCV